MYVETSKKGVKDMPRTKRTVSNENKKQMEEKNASLPEETKGSTNKELISQNLPAKTDDLGIELILKSDSDETFMEKFKRGINIGLKKMNGEFEGRAIIGALFNQLAGRKQILEQCKCLDIYEFGKKYYDMSHTVVYDYMNIFAKFGKTDPETQGYGLIEEVQACSYSVLKELSSVDKEDLVHFIGKDLTVKQIREKKRELKKRKKDQKEGNNQATPPFDQEDEGDSNEGFVDNVEPDCADMKEPDVEAEYKDLSESLLYEKEITVTRKVTRDSKSLRECLDEFNQNNPEYTGPVRVAFYKLTNSQDI